MCRPDYLLLNGLSLQIKNCLPVNSRANLIY